MDGWTLLNSQLNRKVKSTPLAQPAFHPNPPTHHFHEPDADSQPQACAAVLSRHRTVGLREGFKDFLLLVIRNAYACVLYCKVQDCGEISSRLFLNAYKDFSMLGKLDRVP